jgi:glucose/mannose-6-phosphate isomerase
MVRSEIDKEGMYNFIGRFAEEAADAWKKAPDMKLKFRNFMVSGLGGSAIAGDLASCFVSEIPVFVNRGYSVPDYVDRDWLVVLNSYSGNTEETLSAYDDAVRKKAQILVMASGGQLLAKAEQNSHPKIVLPKGMQPRASIMYSFLALLKILQASGIINDVDRQVAEAIELLKDDRLRQEGEKLAQATGARIPLIYAANSMYGVAMRWKTQVNENAKMHAFYNMFSEMNHNEIVGFASEPEKYFVVFLRNHNDHPRMQKRFEVFKEIILSDIYEVWSRGDSWLGKICSLVNIGDWYSYYLAMIRKVDPSPVEIIEGLKKKL